MRAFIGIIAPENVRNVASKIQEELKAVGIVGKCVEIENLHANLSFLDEISESDSLEIAAKMDMIAKGYKKFKASVASVKAIPNKKIVRVVAFDIAQEKNLLHSLSKEIQKSIGGDVKPPHMTLCRVKGLKDKKKFYEIVERYEQTVFAEFDVDSIQLIKSELGEGGPKYSVIHESMLG
jgi:2'-5' RNA ligase